MINPKMVLQAIKYQKGQLEVLDQLQLPHKTHYDQVRSSEDAWHSISDMRVRGAPAIAMVGILGLAVEIQNKLRIELSGQPSAMAVKVIKEKLDYIVTSRPTAVNLKNMAEDFKKLSTETAAKAPSSSEEVWSAFLRAAAQTLETDLRDNKKLGDFGAKWILENTPEGHIGPVSILTHCNTGSLATAGYGTALGVIRSVHESGQLKRAYCTETRPYNQGSRLTAFELVHDRIPATLVTDSMVAALLQLKRASEGIVAIVVGADRITANGDTANKIGTYSLALAAKHHGLKFLVAAPCSTIDVNTPSGDAVKIEERKAVEMTTISGPVVSGSKIELDQAPQRVSIAANGIDVWNPAFDVTPADLIDGIITEKGVVARETSGQFDLPKFLAVGLGP